MSYPKMLDFSKSITIAIGQSLSPALDLEALTCLGVICPAAIEATTVQLGFKGSNSLAGTYTTVTRNGTALKLTFAVNDYGLMPNPADLFGVRFIKIEAQTAASAAVAQATAARTFVVIGEPI